MGFLSIIAGIIFILVVWTSLAYFFNFMLQMSTKRRLNSKKLTDELLIKIYNNMKSGAMPILFLFYSGPIGFILAKKKFLPELLKSIEEKLKERNISL